MGWWKKRSALSLRIQRGRKVLFLQRTASIMIAALLVLPIGVLNKNQLVPTAYAAGAPTVTGVTSNSGPITGGTNVTITGTNFSSISGFSSVSQYADHTCGISLAKNLYCWGYNNRGAIGDGSTTNKSAPTAVDTSGAISGKKFSKVVTGTGHSCALSTDHIMYCWGSNDQGQLGAGLDFGVHSFTPIAVDTSGVLAGKTITDISGGATFTCALADGSAYCWGINTAKQLGTGTNITWSNVPVAVSTSGVLAGKTITKITSNSATTCVLDSTSTAYCWGEGGAGQLGNNTTTSSNIPVAVYTSGVLSGKTIKDLTLGGVIGCVTTTTNNLYCWGTNTNGQVGDNTTTNRSVPTAVYIAGVLSGKTLDRVTPGIDASCVTDTTGKLYCWGRNTGGGVGDNSTTQRNAPVAVNTSGALSGKAIIRFASGFLHTCAITSDYLTYCWGSNQYGQLGTGTLPGDGGISSSLTAIAVTNLPISNPTVTFGGKQATNVAVVNSTTISATTPAAMTTGKTDVIVLSPDSSAGILADSFTYTQPDPTLTSVSPNIGAPAGGTNVTLTGTNFEAITGLTSIVGNSYHTCGITGDKSAYCWGYNNRGQLGDNTQTSRNTPVQVNTSTITGSKKFKKLSAGATHTCALMEDNALYCWGSNAEGQLGANTAYGAHASVPTAVFIAGALSGKTITDISAGGSHTCAVAGGSAYCWGTDLSGQLGTGVNNTRSNVALAVSTAGVLNGKTITTIYAGGGMSCALDAANAAYCWGMNMYGQLGNNTYDDSNSPVAVAMTGEISGKTIHTLALGASHTCAITADSQIFCWGMNTNGQLGNNTTNPQPIPTSITTSGALSGKTLANVTTGPSSTCATDTAGSAYCWGRNDYGALGDGTTTGRLVPTAVSTAGTLSGKKVVKVANGFNFACAQGSDSSIYCWGRNDNGALGDGTNTDSLTPVAATNLPTAQPTVSFGGSAAANVAVTSNTTLTATTPTHANGSVNVVLTSLSGQTATLTNGYTYGTPGPQITAITPNIGPSTGNTSVLIDGSNFVKGGAIISASAGGYHSCAVTNNSPYCWGKNDKGQLGNNSTTQSTIPALVDTSGVLNGKTITEITTGTDHTCALDSDGLAYCWGEGGAGQLGNNTASSSSVPVAVDMSGALSGKTILDISSNANSTCVIASDHHVYCWGDNMYGQLGDGSATTRAVPVAVDTSGALSGKTITALSVGNSHTCAAASDGTAYCWGLNMYGQIGDGNTGTASVIPVAVDATGYLNGRSVSSISAGFFHTCAVTTDGEAYCWGWNANSQLGNGTTTDSPTPTAVATGGALSGKHLTTVSANGANTCALDTNGAVYCWGINVSGQLGDGTTTNSNSPVAVSTSGELAGVKVRAISFGLSHICARGDNGRVYCWGYNSNGQIGDNSTTQRSLPTAPYGADIIDDASTVTFDNQPATSVVVLSSTQIRAETPAHVAQTVDVKVTNPDNQSATLTNGYEYIFAPSAPHAPTNLTATPTGSSVNLSWTAPADNGGSAVTDYLVQYSVNAGGGWLIYSHPASTATSINVDGLSPGTAYSFRIIAVNSVGNSAPSNVVSASPTYVSLSTSGSVSMSVLADGGARSSNAAQSLTLGTNNENGYLLTLETLNANRNLVSGSDTIAPVAGSQLVPSDGLTTDSWGYRVDGVGGFGSGTTSETNVLASVFSWAGVPANGNANTIRSNSSAVANDIFSVWYGMSANSDKPSGTYSNTVLYTAVAN